MRITPKTAAEVEAGTLLPPGNYSFEIVTAEDTISKTSGNEMIKLKVRLFSDEGSATTVFDYLMESVAYKLRHACEACGLMTDYENGNIEAWMFEGKTGMAKVSVQKDKTGQYPDRNGIQDYLPPAAPSLPGAAKPAARKAAPAMADDLDDIVPF